MNLGVPSMRTGAHIRNTIGFVFLTIKASCTHRYAPGTLRRDLRLKEIWNG
jgi:hypothetical protein